jgi:sugar phosphate isomerase/epimerase
MPDPMTRVLWDWNVHAYDIHAKLEAATAGGFDVLTVPYRVYAPWLREGGDVKQLLRRAEDAGVRLDFLDGMTSWSSIRYPADNELVKAAMDFSVDGALRLCEQLELRHVVAIPGFDVEQAPPISQLIDEFGRFCERAARHGLSVDLEFMGMLGICRLDVAAEIVQGAGQPNAAVMFDTWHFVRGNNTLEDLRELPTGTIRNIQVADGGQQPAFDSLWDDSALRSFAGEGELALEEILAVCFASQEIETVGPEAIPQDLDQTSPAELGKRAADRTNRLIDQVLNNGLAR